MPLTVVGQAVGVRVATFGPVLVSVWDGRSSHGGFDLLEQTGVELLTQYKRVLSLSIVASIDTDAKIAKTRGIAMIRKFDPHNIGTATVILPRGFAAVFARNFMTAFGLVNGARAPGKVFSEVSEAVQWLSALPGSERYSATLKMATSEIIAFSSNVNAA